MFVIQINKRKGMKKEAWSKLSALVLLSAIWLGGCSNTNSMDESENQSLESTQIDQSESTETVIETPVDEEMETEVMTDEVETPEKDDSTGKDESLSDEMYEDEMENMRFFRWDGIVESLPYQVVMHSIDENNYANVVIDLSEINRVMEEEALEYQETIYYMIRQIINSFPDRETESYLFDGYCIQFAKFESSLAAELMMTSEDYINTDWEKFDGILASGGEVLINDLMMN